MKKHLVRIAAAAILGGCALVAEAGIVNLTGWTFGSGNTINVTTPTHNGPAGGFTGSLSGFGAFSTPSFQTYCVELTQSFNLPSGNMSGYSILTPAAYGEWTVNPATAHRIGQLVTYVNAHPGAVDTASESTSMQLAIWNSIYDTDNTLNGGTFSDTSSYRAYANTLLANSLSTVSNVHVYIVANREKQDFLVTTPVPEPSTYALMIAGLMGMTFVARRRRARY